MGSMWRIGSTRIGPRRSELSSRIGSTRIVPRRSGLSSRIGSTRIVPLLDQYNIQLLLLGSDRRQRQWPSGRGLLAL